MPSSGSSTSATTGSRPSDERRGLVATCQGELRRAAATVAVKIRKKKEVRYARNQMLRVPTIGEILASPSITKMVKGCFAAGLAARQQTGAPNLQGETGRTRGGRTKGQGEMQEVGPGAGATNLEPPAYCRRLTLSSWSCDQASCILCALDLRVATRTTHRTRNLIAAATKRPMIKSRMDFGPNSPMRVA
jgi:hypothetical protein